MSTIGRLLGHNPLPDSVSIELLPNVGAIGLELELEGLQNWPQVSGWRQESDNSLRDGLEYVFDGPLAGASAVEAIRNMATTLQGNPPSPSFRCSTHIHMDVRDCDFHELEMIALAYVMMEGVMFDHCSMERRYSNFCTPFFVNNSLARQLTQSLSSSEDVSKLHHLGAWPKYSALNLKPVTNYGSVEFRGSHAMTTFEDLLGLSQRMLHLKRVVKGFGGSGIEFVQYVHNLGVTGVFQQGLATGYVPDEASLDQGYATALGIASRRLSTLSTMRARRSEAPQIEEIRRFNDHMVVLDLDKMEDYNLFPVERMRLTQLIKMVKALRLMNHPNPPSILTFTVSGAFVSLGGAANVVETLRHLGINPREIGML